MIFKPFLDEDIFLKNNVYQNDKNPYTKGKQRDGWEPHNISLLTSMFFIAFRHQELDKHLHFSKLFEYLLYSSTYRYKGGLLVNVAFLTPDHD